MTSQELTYTEIEKVVKNFNGMPTAQRKERVNVPI